VYSRYNYHNDKFNKPNGTRDEYRIYLNKLIDPDLLYKAKDIVVFERIMLEEDTLMPVYFMYRFEPNDENYSFLDELVRSSKINGDHARFDGNLSFINSTIQSVQQSDAIISDDAKFEIAKQQQEILKADTDDNLEEDRGAHLFNSSSFREFVLLAYKSKCAITRKVISWEALNNLEAAHIMPKAQSGTFLPCNGIALCRDMHWAFDKGFITVTDEFYVRVHEDMKGRSSTLDEYDGKKIFLPVEPFFQPAQKFLKHHQTRIFGLFQRSGVIRSE
jgi:predicted restriction endonuclease